MEGSVIYSDAKMAAESPEDSSWTFYIQGFMYDNNDDDDKDSENESPSLVSDAASSAVKKFANNFNSRENHGVKLGFSTAKTNSISKQNSFKKQKTKVTPAITDYDLEDTASSPINSPKQVSYINQFMNQRGKAKMEVSEVKRNNFGEGRVYAVERDSNYTDLKKKPTLG